MTQISHKRICLYWLCGQIFITDSYTSHPSQYSVVDGLGVYMYEGKCIDYNK